ncbi:hypothetical protein GOODEAATRI_005602 [Goodea atripinnis]|uniref:L27 domain-containing protein n=1 Tax=Goodea atripinnis TaxID=208336 RepID=A0ABV0NBG2_9TELE
MPGWGLWSLWGVSTASKRRFSAPAGPAVKMSTERIELLYAPSLSPGHCAVSRRTPEETIRGGRLAAVERLQAKLKERGEVPTEEKLSLLRSVLQSPLFHQILALQKSVQHLRDQV